MVSIALCQMTSRFSSSPWAFLVFLLGSIACSNSSDVPLDAFGGYSAIQREATGWFRVEQVDDRWMFITPTGHGFLALGANHTGRYLKEAHQSTSLYTRIGGDSLRAQEAMRQAYHEAGLNAGEAYLPLDPYLKERLPYVAHFDYPGSKHAFDVFDDSVQTAFRQALIPACRQIANDSLVLGVAFVDLPIWDSRRVDFYRALPAAAPGKTEYVRFLEDQYAGEIQSLNQAYGTQFTSFTDLSAATAWTLDTNQATVQQDDDLFMGRIAAVLYPLLKGIVREGAPHHLFMGERYVLRMVPEPVLRVVGQHVDIFCTQALILSPQRPPEWQVFQPAGFDSTFAVVQKPMLVIDWATPFSLDSTYVNDRGTIKEEAVAAEDVAQWVESALERAYIVGVFKCQFIGTHGNDRWFPEGRMKRTLWQDDGTAFPVMTKRVARAHREALQRAYTAVADGEMER